MSSSSAPAKSKENGNASTSASAAAASNTFNVLNSGTVVGSGSTGAQLQPRGPSAAALRPPAPVRAMGNYRGASAPAPAGGVAGSPFHGVPTPLSPHQVQQLMALAGWGSRRPPLLLPPSPSLSSGRYPAGHGMPPSSFAYHPPGASSSGSVAVQASNGAVAVQGGGVGGNRPPGGGRGKQPANERSRQVGGATATGAAAGARSAGRGKPPSNAGAIGRGKGRGKLPPPNATLQIGAIAAGSAAGATNNVAPSGGDANAAAVQHMAPVLAMPTTGVDKGKAVAAAPSGRGRKRAAPKGNSSSSDPAGSKKPRQRVSGKKAAGGKVDAAAADASLIAAVANPPSSNPEDAQSKDPSKTTAPPPAAVAATTSSNDDPSKTTAPPPAAASNDDPNKTTAPSPVSTTAPSTSRSKKKKNSNGAAASKRNSAVGASAKKKKKHTVLTWLMDGGFLKEREQVFYVPPSGGAEKVITGTVTKSGIKCACCNAVMPIPALESHAGCAQPAAGQPWEKLLLLSGKTLLRCMQEAWGQERARTMRAQEKAGASMEKEREKSSMAKRKVAKTKKQGVAPVLERAIVSVSSGLVIGRKDSGDGACGVCADAGGQLLLCDSCTSTFHPNCIAIKVTEGSWSCHFCRCILCIENDLQDLYTCQQCTRKYHLYCRPLLNTGRQVGPYCSETCKKINGQLSDMIGVMNHTEDGFSWALLKIQKDEPITSEDMPAIIECNVKLAVALGVLQECFDPVKDQRTQIDMIQQAVYSLRSEFKRVSYEGFYTMVLEKDGEIISAALLRFHGKKLAEMPFACTLPAYQKQGMLRRLVNAVEQVLASVQVENLVTPSAAALVDTWQKSFSFMPVQPELRQELNKLSLVVVAGTTPLHKHIVPVVAAQQQQSEEEEEEPVTAASPLTDEEIAFLDMKTSCSFTDLVVSGVFNFSNSSVMTMLPANS